MGLRETLNKLKNEQEARLTEEQKRPIIIAKWQAAVNSLLGEVERALAGYVADRSITIKSVAFRHQDESFEPVDLRRLEIKAGDKAIEVVPLGRICFGAIGLAAMRCGNRQVKFSRQGDEDTNQDVWRVILPIVPELDQFGRPVLDFSGNRYEDVSSDLIEQSLEYVLG